jgi:hypothetical protein
MTGFPIAAKTRYNSAWQTGKSIALAYFHRHGFVMPERAIGRAKFRAYMLLTHP